MPPPRLLEAMASVLGIGGFESVELRGGADAGFATSAEVVSFDARFPRNVECGGGDCPRYVFSSHSLRRRDGTLFDATFDRLYREEDEAVYLSIKYVPGRTIGSPLVVFEKSPASLVLDEPGTAPTSYGSWDYYSYLPERPFELLPMATLHRPGEVPRPQFASVDFEIVKDDAGRRFLAIVAVLQVKTFSADKLHLRGALTKNEKLISNKPRREDPRFTVATIDGEGEHVVKLRFSGEDIFRSDEDGPYRLQVDVHQEGGSRLSDLDWETPPYDHTLFGGARIDALEIGASPLQASFLTREPGLYRYIARIAKDGKTLGYTTGALQLEPGTHRVPLSFASPEAEADTVSFEILDPNWESEAYVKGDLRRRTSALRGSLSRQ